MTEYQQSSGYINLAALTMYTAQLWWNHTVYSFHRLMFVIIIFYDDCSDDHAIVVPLVYSLSVVYRTANQLYKVDLQIHYSFK